MVPFQIGYVNFIKTKGTNSNQDMDSRGAAFLEYCHLLSKRVCEFIILKPNHIMTSSKVYPRSYYFYLLQYLALMGYSVYTSKAYLGIKRFLAKKTKA